MTWRVFLLGPVERHTVEFAADELTRPRGLLSVACDVTLSNQRVTVDQILKTMEAVMDAPAYEQRLGLSWRCPSCRRHLMGASWALVGSRCPECKANP